MKVIARLMVLLAVLCAVGAAAWFGRRSLLQAAVDLWAVSDTVEPADAVAVFGGGAETRAVAAAEYYRRGLTRKVLLANVRLSEVGPNIFHSETDLNRGVLIEAGVPEAAIELIGADLSSTYEEAVALRNWAYRNHPRRLIVPTEYFSSRRVRWIVDHELLYTGARAEVIALDYPSFSRVGWWKNEQAVWMFETEVVKYIYYRLRY